MKNKTKKKVIVAAALAAVLLVGAIVSIVLVLAAQNQNISSNIRISYSVDGVGAKVRARYGIVPLSGTISMSDMTTPDSGATELVFNVTDTDDGSSLVPDGDIDLTTEMGTEVVFEYIFENTADSAFTVDLIVAEVGDNFNTVESFYVSAVPLAENRYSRINENKPVKQVVVSEDTLYIYIKVSVENVNKQAAYNKDYAWQLNKIETSEATITLNNGAGSGEESEITAIVGAAIPVITNLPTAPSGMGFVGYYDAATDGTMYVSSNGVGVKEIEEDITLYARYTEAAVIDYSGGIVYGISPTATNVTEIVIPNDATEIAEGAFAGTSTKPSPLTSITIGDDSIQTAAYAGGSQLKKIGKNAFGYCRYVEHLYFNVESMPDFESLNDIFSRLGSNVTNGVEVVIGDNVKTIPGNFLYSTSNLDIRPNITTIVIGENVKRIGPKAFFNLTALDKVYYNAIKCGDIETGNPNQIFNYSARNTDGFTAVIGAKVQRTPNRLFHTSNLVTVEFAENCVVEEFGKYSFYKNQLTSFTIPETVRVVDDLCFSMNRPLTALHIPKSVEEFGVQNTQYLDSLTSLTVAEDNPKYYSANNCIINKYTLELVAGCNISEIPQDQGILKIGYGAFDRCDKLTSITIPDSVTEIDVKAFQYSGLTEIELPNSIKTIGNYAFYACKSLTNVRINKDVETLGSELFGACSELTILEIPAKFPMQGGKGEGQLAGLSYYFNDFANADHPSVVISNDNIPLSLKTVILHSDTTVPDYAFYGMSNLTSIIIEDTFTSVGTGALQNCANLEYLYLSKNITEMEEGSLLGSYSIIDFTFNADVIEKFNGSEYDAGIGYFFDHETFYEIGEGGGWGTITFNGGTELSGSAFIYDSVETMIFCEGFERIELAYIWSLTNVILNSDIKVVNISDGGCEYLNLKTLVVPSSVTSLYIHTIIDNIYYEGTEEQWNNIFDGIIGDCNIYSESVTRIDSADDFTGLTNDNIKPAVMICGEVTEIPEYAFYNASNLFTKIKYISIGLSVKTIKDQAFRKCTGVTSLIIPDSVTTINQRTFAEMTALTTIKLSNSLKEISEGLFSGCSVLKSLTIPNSVEIIQQKAFMNCKQLTTLKLSDTLKSFGYQTFTSCIALKSITIPYSLREIASGMFTQCTALTNVEFENKNNWRIFQTSTSTNYYDLDVSNSTTNAENLKNKTGSFTATTTNWGSYYLKRKSA